MTSSYWLSETHEPIPEVEPSDGVDVAIVGGGVTGCACAHVLAEAGRRVRVYEAREIAGGASGRNGGFALRGGAPAYDVAREQLGPERARELWRLTERYLDRLENLAGDAFRRTGSSQPTVTNARSWTRSTRRYARTGSPQSGTTSYPLR